MTGIGRRMGLRRRIIAVAVLLMFLSGFTPLASSSFLGGEEACAQSGAISGTVTGELDPDGVMSVMVAVYSEGGQLETSVWTGEDGGYVVQGLMPGWHKIHFYTDCTRNNYAGEWYDDHLYYADADTVEVYEDQETGGVDAYLVTGSISGIVTSPEEPGGVENVDVFVYDSEGDFVSSAVTGTGGAYRVNNVGTGDYYVYVYPWHPNAHDGRTYAYEWYLDQGALEEADPVPAIVGEETAGIDFELESGSISGTVTGLDEPGGLEDIDVYVHDSHFNLVGTATSGGGGQYTVKGIRPGTYAVYFDPTYIREELGEDYCGEFHDNKDAFALADPVVVASDVTGVDAVLEQSCSISGQVTDGSGGVEGLYVHVYHAHDGSYWVAFAETGPDGCYTISGLAPGDYKVSFNHASGQNYVDEWYDGKPDFASADAVHLDRGGAATGVDAFMSGAGSISGTVTGSDTSGGLEGVQVLILDADYAFIGGTLTASDGSYSVGGMGTGDYYIEFRPGEELNYKGEFYDDRPSFDESDPVPVTYGSDTPGKDAELQRYGSVSGKVTSADYPGGLEGVQVTAFLSPGTYFQGSAVSDESGDYVIEGLAGGEYTLYFEPFAVNQELGSDYAGEWYEDKASYAAPDPVTVAWGSDSGGVNAFLEAMGEITGRVTSNENPQGVDGYWVYAYDSGHNYVMSAVTQSDGYYSLPVKPGTYRVQFGWEGRWYDGKFSFDSADDVTVDEAQTVSGIDCYIGGTGSISGKVTSDSQPGGVQYAGIELYREADSWWIYYTETDENGEYSIENVPEGGYRIRFIHQTCKWYDDKAGKDSADIILVEEGLEAGAIDAHFSDDPSIQGRVASPGQPGGVQDVVVNVIEVGGEYWDWVAGAFTDSNGDYEIVGLAPGDYKVMFDPPQADDYLLEWYNDKDDYEAADNVTVPVGAPATGIDASLESGGRISGTITSASGVVSDADVYVYDQDYNLVGNAWAQGDGTYETSVLPSGDYKVEFSPWGAYFGEWYDDQPDFDSAGLVDVAAGTVHTGVDAFLDEPGTISGTVNSASEPGGVEGVEVYLYDQSNPDTWLDMAVTGSDGFYQFNWVRPGDSRYKVAFSPISGMDYAEEWYENKTDFGYADGITVDYGMPTVGIDASLETGGSIIGQVASQSMPGGIEGVGVYAYTPDGEYARSSLTDGGGMYSITGLAGGDYEVYFDPGGLPYKDEWYEDKPDLSNADAVGVVLGVETPGIDALLDDSGSVSGRVTSDAHPEGVGDIYVHAYPHDDQGSWAGYAVTRGDGSYSIEEMVPGRYKVIFNTSSGQNYKSVWYDGKPSFDEADEVVVDERINTGNIDCHLTEYGTISGRVTDGGGAGLAEVVVLFHPEDGETIDPAITNGEGYYTRSGLEEGSYKIEFLAPWGSPYAPEWYDDKPDEGGADAVELSYGEKKENVDAQLSDDGAPLVHWVMPEEGMDTQSLNEVFIYGENFVQEGSTPPMVFLVGEGYVDIKARDVELIDSNSLTCDINLIGSDAGMRDVMVVNPNRQAGLGEDGFEIVHKPQPPTIYGPATAGVGDVPLHGESEVGTTVNVYMRAEGATAWNDAGEAAVNYYGNWDTTVKLAAGAYEFRATASNTEMESDPSGIITVVVDQPDQLAVLQEYKAVMFGSTYWPDPGTGVIYMAAFSGAEIGVKFKFSSAPDDMSFHFKEKDYPISGPDGAGWYTVTLSGWSWSIGLQEGILSYNDNGRDFKRTMLSIALIDPSGYIYDSGTGQRVQVAQATLQYFYGGSWIDWPAGEYGQVNPQYTDTEGKYGWDVHPGKYRVLVEKASYQSTISEEVTVVLDPIYDLNIGMARNKPAIASLSPDTGLVGVTVTVKGGNFGAVQAGSSVIFSNERKAAATSWSDASITCVVPQGTVTGDVVVETASGRSNGVRFTLATPGGPQPEIMSIEPTSGEIGSEVTVKGGNFGAVQAGSSVIFSNERKAAVTSWSDASITCVVPDDAVSGNVVVETANGRSNGMWFSVLPAAEPAGAATTWYLAEGYTGGEFDTWVLVQNPGSEDASVTLDFQLKAGDAA
ncbi:MAG: carboxypeptidase regulatory-like domain-containing protein, partial [Actinomycetota bacterium]|nr:carboxypeptidase regulatory-like domain-containing protein [Actinomycetota bacterium]